VPSTGHAFAQRRNVASTSQFLHGMLLCCTHQQEIADANCLVTLSLYSDPRTYFAMTQFSCQLKILT